MPESLMGEQSNRQAQLIPLRLQKKHPRDLNMHQPQWRLPFFLSLLGLLTSCSPVFGFPTEGKSELEQAEKKLKSTTHSPRNSLESSPPRKKQKMDLQIDLHAEREELGTVPEQRPVLDFVFDLDETLVFTDRCLKRANTLGPHERVNELLLDPETGKAKIQIQFQIGTEEVVCEHLLAPGALEVLAYLSQMEGARLNFFSGGIEARNLPLTRVLMHEVQKLTQKIIPYAVLSKDHLEVSPTGENRKNILRIAEIPERSDLDLNYSVLIDDNLEYVHPEQFDNLLLIHSALNPITTQQQLKMNLIRVLGIIIEAVEWTHSSIPCVSLIGALQQVQTPTQAHPTFDALDEEHYRIGLKAVRTINPDFPSLEETPEVP
ncbi:MAG: hypothetical protein ACO3A2_03485 [Bdellovibrionia bacterium]